jgi:hypothetical protein
MEGMDGACYVGGGGVGIGKHVPCYEVGVRRGMSREWSDIHGSPWGPDIEPPRESRLFSVGAKTRDGGESRPDRTRPLCTVGTEAVMRRCSRTYTSIHRACIRSSISYFFLRMKKKNPHAAYLRRGATPRGSRSSIDNEPSRHRCRTGDSGKD